MSFLSRVLFSLAIMFYLNKVAFSSQIFRIYAQDDVFANTYFPTSGLGAIRPVSEIQVSLAFARDYDDHGHHTNGRFRSYWNQSSVTPQLISEFKQNYTKVGLKVNVFVSIGDRDPRYPFQLQDGNVNPWVSNAVESLKSIVQEYHLDGIDVYYEHINPKNDFLNAIGKLIKKLKEDKVITVASIAPSEALNNDYYVPLYNAYGESCDTVVYQLHNEVEPAHDPNTLVERFTTEAAEKYDKHKLLAGYSAIFKDWGTVSPIVYFLGGLKLLVSFNPFVQASAVGTSIWFVAPDFPPSSDWCTFAVLSSSANAPHVRFSNN